MASISGKALNIQKRQLFTPTLDEIKRIITPALQLNFEEASVDVVDCPDLTQSPFTLASSGLGGNAKILEVGGPGYLLPLVQRDKVYDLKTIVPLLNYSNKVFVIGAGAGPWPQLSHNSEMMMNVLMAPNELKNATKLAWVESGHCVLQQSSSSDTRFSLLANLFACEGAPGKVLKVHAKKRTGKLDFIATMQKALESHYKNQLVGLGGTFLLKEGKAKQHVMSDFSTNPITTVDELNNWLNFFDMQAPLVAVGTFVSAESDLDLRVQHFHSFSDHNEGGHYHIDTTPETVEYLGYFNIADSLYRVDQPTTSFSWGKD